MDEYIFHAGLDSHGYDLCYLGPDSPERMKLLCKLNRRCVGFNTLGYYKFHIRDKAEFQKIDSLVGPVDGLYVHRKRYLQTLKREQTKSYAGFEGYDFYQGKDSNGCDLKRVASASIADLKAMCDADRECVAFNTLGFLKYQVAPEHELVEFYPELQREGLYVKKGNIRVKMICNWCSPEQLLLEWNPMSKGNFRWNDIEITAEDRDVDFYVIINKPSGSEHYDPARTVVFQMEPWCGEEHQTWGVKTWGEWAEPDEAKFLHVRTHRKYVNTAFWQLRSTYHDLKTGPIVKTKVLSTICSSKYFDPGHIKRVDFLKYIEQKKDDTVQVDIYGYENPFGFAGYKGPHPPGYKDAAILPYKYCFLAENNREHNFMTEKIWEPLLAESLCFYWGCPNLSDAVDPRAYVPLDLDDFEKSFHTMKEAILNREWEKRLEIIRREKQKVLEHYQFFPTLERILRHDLKLPYHPSDDEVLYHKYFHELIGRPIRNACFIHSCTLNGNTDVLKDLLRTIRESGLMEKLDCMFIVNLGDDVRFDIPDAGGNIHWISYSKDVRLYEKPTLNLLRIFSKLNRGARVLYLHTKGVSYSPPHPFIADWRNYMLYHLVENHRHCMELLGEWDTAGCNLLEQGPRHYSGNFWWANSDYLAQLPPIESDDRHGCEFWLLGRDSVRAFSLHNSGINHYRQPYPREAYVTQSHR